MKDKNRGGLGKFGEGMALRQRKRFQKPGLAEYIAAGLGVLVAVLAVLWWRAGGQPDWWETSGRVVHFEVRPIHYNAPDYQPKVSLTYEYSARGESFTGEWSGFWPSVESPNALPEHRLDELGQEDFDLTVFYDPDNPKQSRLHYARGDRGRLYGGLFVVGLVVTAYYYLRVYPAWKGKTGR